MDQKTYPAMLLLEGGSLRTLFTAGVLDVFMEHGVDFTDVMGVSAGALTGVSFVTKQIGRTREINVDHILDKNYLGVRNLVLHHQIFNFDYMLGEMSTNIVPLDYEAFLTAPTHFTAVATELETGETRYLEKSGCADIFSAIRASSSMPMVSKTVPMGGKRYLDGGCSNAIPYQKAIDDGFEKIVLVLTRQQGYRKLYTAPAMAKAYAQYFRHFPAFLQKLLEIPTRYDREQREIDVLEKAGRVFVIRPAGPVDVSHTETDQAKLTALYNEGRAAGEARLGALLEYLEH